MAAYEKAHIDEITSKKWPHWIPVRHHFGIETFGINLWRGQEDGTVIPEHEESASGAPELYYVVELGRAARGLFVLGDHGAVFLPPPQVDAEGLDSEVVADRDPVRPLLRGDLVDVSLLVCSHGPSLVVR